MPGNLEDLVVEAEILSTEDAEYAELVGGFVVGDHYAITTSIF